MRQAIHIILGVAASIGLALAVWYSQEGGLIKFVVVGLLTLASLIFLRRLPLAIRVFATGGCFYMSYSCFLIGRTTHPGFSLTTLPIAISCFVILGAIPALSLLAIWEKPVARKLLILLIPVSWTAAEIVAYEEEKEFVAKYRVSGVGPTGRKTIPAHWLSYDVGQQKLDGSD